MNIALIGASGFVGSAILKEALARQHKVTALVSNPAKLAAAEGLTVKAVDVQDFAGLTAQLKGFDAVITAFSGHAQGDVEGYYVAGMRNIIGASKEARVPRLLVVGGAGSLEVAPGVQALDTPTFPAQSPTYVYAKNIGLIAFSIYDQKAGSRKSFMLKAHQVLK